MDYETIQALRTTLRRLMVKAKTEGQILEALDLGSNPSFEERLLHVLFGGTTLQLPSGVKREFEFIEHMNSVCFIISPFGAAEEEPGDPILGITIPLDEGDPYFWLGFRQDDEDPIYLMEGEPVWRLVERLLKNLKIDPI